MLYKHLRSLEKRYQKRSNTNNRRGQIPDRISIEMRPEIVDKKERFGDLEIDIIIGKAHKGALLTINERTTGMLKMAYIKSKEAIEIERKTIQLLKPWLPFIHTITSDNGKEFSNHKAIAEELNIDFYFTKQYHSLQRGVNENLNNRPRKRDGFLTPNENFDEFIASNSDITFIT